MSRWSSINCPNFKLGHLSKLGQKKHSKINSVTQLPQLPQLSRAPVRVREQREQAAPAADFHFKLGQLGQLGQRVEIASEFGDPTFKPRPIRLGQLGRGPVAGPSRPQNRMRGGEVRGGTSERVRKTGFTKFTVTVNRKPTTGKQNDG